MNTRTVRDFVYKGNAKEIINEWAKSHGYRFKEKIGDQELYQRGTGFWTAPMRFMFKQEGDKVHLEIYVYTPFFNRLMAFFIVPQEMNVDSGGFRLAIPKSIARKDFNALLQQFNQTPIP